MDNLIAGLESLVAGGRDLAIAGLAIVALAEAAIILLWAHRHARWQTQADARERDLSDALAQARRQTATTAPGIYTVADRSGRRPSPSPDSVKLRPLTMDEATEWAHPTE